ncbi:MAG: hypothetical protein K2W86_10360 [Sphingomonas sp.]|uniref:hypothetical protein n=1 Tax=Sphingomonas sp. TaxID=28214 RepID=UPI0035A83C83|nr:hypothetical protein [Sphingomonas sp.]
MTIDRDKIAAEAFFLYAETYLPSEVTRAETLAALQLCADGTSRATPSVATYVFRPSALSAVIGERLHPGSVALESTELYLTNQGFRDHLATDEFRTGLRAMYKGTRRLGARLFWIGARPASDILHNIFRSDPDARPIATVREKLFDADVHAASDNRDVAMVSVLCPVETGKGAVAIDLVDAIAAQLTVISFAAFFHPLAPDLLRLFMVLPINDAQPARMIAEGLAPLGDLVVAPGRMLGTCQTHRDRADLAGTLAAALAATNADWQVMLDGYSGYVSHPLVATDAND